LTIDCVDGDGCTHLPRVIDDQPRDVAGTGGQIEHAHFAPRQNPAPEKMLNQRIAAEIAIELAQVPQIARQLRRDRLRTIHQFRFPRIELPLHKLCSGGL
jgi:hypothetical protein